MNRYDNKYRDEKPSEYWRGLIDKYFEAETDDSEEAALRRFLSSDKASSSEFDEIKAVMGFTAVGKRLHGKKLGRTTVVKYISVAASAAAIFIGAWLLYDSENQCVAYIGGKKYTDKEVVIAEMHKSMQTVGDISDQETVGDALNDIFRTINESKE